MQRSISTITDCSHVPHNAITNQTKFNLIVMLWFKHLNAGVNCQFSGLVYRDTYVVLI